MDMATQQILSGLTAGDQNASGGGGSGGLASFGSKVQEYWNTVKTDQAQQPPGGGGYGGPSELQEVIAEKEALDGSFKHATRLLDQEIERLQSPRGLGGNGGQYGGVGGGGMGDGGMLRSSEKIYIPPEDQRRFNLVGRLLGPKGLTLKRMQAETQTKMTILGRGSMRDKKREEELRESGDPAHSHLNDDLHVLIEVNGPFNQYKLLAGAAEVRKMLIPNEDGVGDPMGMKYLSPDEQQMYANSMQGPPRGRGGGGGGGRGGGNFGSPRGRGGGSPRGRGGGRGRGRGGGGIRGGGGRGRGGGGGGGRGGGMGGMQRVTDMASYDHAPQVGYGDSQVSGGGAMGGATGSYDDQSYTSRGGPPLLAPPTGTQGGVASGGSYAASHDHYSNVAGGGEDQYYNNYSESSGGGGGGERQWSSKMAHTSRGDTRYHPYQTGGGGATGGGYY